MIYTDSWGLDFFPFANDNRPETYVPTHATTLCLARLRYALGVGMGASALYGQAGSGKSRVARIIMQEFIASNWLTAYLPSPTGSARDILAALCPQTAATLSPGTSGTVELQQFLLNRSRNNFPILLMVDDVQTTRGTEFLEILRTLLNIEHEGIKALSILLIGQPSMERKLITASGFDSQLVIRAILEPMTDEEARLYILARLKAAGSKQGIFTRQAAELVVTFARGLPRQINRICELSLIIAYGLEESKVTPNIVEMAAADLDLLPAGEAAFFRWPHPLGSVLDHNEENDLPQEDDILATIPATTKE